MTLVVPTLRLIKQVTPGEPDVYILESSAIFENENFESSGHGPIPTALNSDGDLDIELLISDSTNSNSSGSSTVEHVVMLGSLNFGVESFRVVVEIYNAGIKKGRGHVSTEKVVIISRPNP